MTGASLGTPLYISPEQAEGRRDINLRTDIYSLGTTLYHLIAGAPPYTGESVLSYHDDARERARSRHP